MDYKPDAQTNMPIAQLPRAGGEPRASKPQSSIDGPGSEPPMDALKQSPRAGRRQRLKW